MSNLEYNFSIEDLLENTPYPSLCEELAIINAGISREKYIFDPDKSPLARQKSLFSKPLEKTYSKKQYYGVVLDIQPGPPYFKYFYKVFVDVPGLNKKVITHPDIFASSNIDLDFYEDLIFYPTDIVSSLENVPLLGGIAIVEISRHYPNHTEVDKYGNKFIKMINFKPYVPVLPQNRKLNFSGPLFSRYGAPQSSGGTAAADSTSNPPTSELDRSIVESKTLPFNKRLEAFSKKYIGIKYVNGPLGEESGKDTDPRLRYDAFDCVTYVETMMTLATAKREGDMLALMDQVRYTDGTVGFKTRRHIMESQWIPENIRRGAIREVGSSLRGSNTKTFTKTFTEETVKAIPDLEVPGQDRSIIPRGSFSLPVVPVENLSGIASEIPNGSLLTIVRSNADSHVSLVTHTAIFFRDESGRAFVRHAAQGSTVIEQPYNEFIQRMIKVGGSRKLLGFAIYEIQDPTGN